MSISTLILFIAILFVLVMIHELGHFVAAKLVGMRVDEFAFGFPPRIFAKKKGETVYAINALPIGGYVSIWGENGLEENDIQDGAKHHPRAFGNRPKWAQLIVLLAGVAMNMVLALFLYVGVSFGSVNVSTTDEIYGSRVKDISMVVENVAPGSPAERAGIVPGVTITSLTSKGDKAVLTSEDTLVRFIAKHNNDPLTFTFVSLKGEEITSTIAAVYGIVPDKKAIGIAVDTVGPVKLSVFESISLGFERTYNMTVMTWNGIGDVFSMVKKGENVLQSLSGPVGIAKIVGQTSEYGVASVLTLVAILSINLAIFNVLPLPALDGGRVVIIFIETIIRRKIPIKYLQKVNLVGFALLLLLLVAVTISDVTK